MSEKLTEGEIDRIAEVLTPANLKTFAIRYLDFTQDFVNNIEAKHPVHDQQGFKHEVLNTWAKKNDQNKNILKKKLKMLAEKDGLVTWHLVEGIWDKDDDNATPEAKSNAAASVGPELTDAMLDKLSEQITSEGDLRTLAIQGLGVTENVVSMAIKDNRSEFKVAVSKVLKDWRRKCKHEKGAHYALSKALDDVNMSYYITKALKST